MRGAGLSLIFASLLYAFLPLYGAILEPKLFIRAWDMFLALLVLPCGLCMTLLFLARKRRRDS